MREIIIGDRLDSAAIVSCSSIRQHRIFENIYVGLISHIYDVTGNKSEVGLNIIFLVFL